MAVWHNEKHTLTEREDRTDGRIFGARLERSDLTAFGSCVLVADTRAYCIHKSLKKEPLGLVHFRTNSVGRLFGHSVAWPTAPIGQQVFSPLLVDYVGSMYYVYAAPKGEVFEHSGLKEGKVWFSRFSTLANLYPLSNVYEITDFGLKKYRFQGSDSPPPPKTFPGGVPYLCLFKIAL